MQSQSQEHLQRPAPVLKPQYSFQSQVDHGSSPHPDHDGDYDPCQNAKISSPFYLYNHDSPRPSQDLRRSTTEVRGKPSIHVDVRDLELGETAPSITQEKINAQQRKLTLAERMKFWERDSRKQRCLTKPKKQSWLQRLPKKQRIMVRAVIALVIIGTMIGIAVGIAAALNSGVYGSDKTVGEHR